MSFHREQIIKNPRKNYNCDWCGKPIKGEHLYLVGMQDDFYTSRVHINCERKMSSYCYDKCKGDCQGNIMDCYFEMKQEQEK